MAGEGGFEPPHTDPETAVLPLDDSPTELIHHITAQIQGSNREIIEEADLLVEARTHPVLESHVRSHEKGGLALSEREVKAVIEGRAELERQGLASKSQLTRRRE